MSAGVLLVDPTAGRKKMMPKPVEERKMLYPFQLKESERQKIMQKEKCRFTGRSYETYIPTIVSAEKSSDSAGQSGSSNQIAKLDGGQTSVTSGQPLNADVELTECRIYCYLSDIHVFVLTLTLALSSIWQSLLFTNCCFSV
ncbi:uncharacterized protein LOC109823442 isoform X4 [Asparagus officinalis]|uniref:uncharacterized protein LOC109823442 isoform X4 n=1 Tax=Asparagus officinalis TaxID=4686 RepID=UPI00098E6E6D|nr:uncharacterized protein LOC109823442 isoform X4 [Asparagus officinalis]